MCDITFEKWDDILSGQENFSWTLSEHYTAIYLFNNQQFPVAFAFKLSFYLDILYTWYIWQTLSLVSINANWQTFSLANRMILM